MRILLDGCVPRRLGAELAEHEVRTAPQMGWANLDDGPLLDSMAGLFDVLITVDRSLLHQQRLSERPLAVVVLRAKTNRLSDLVPKVPALRALLEGLRPGQGYEVSD